MVGFSFEKEVTPNGKSAYAVFLYVFFIDNKGSLYHNLKGRYDYN